MEKKHIVIVGAGPGIGLGAARAFGTAGFAVSLLARRQDALNDAVATLRASGVSAEAFVADAGHAAGMTAAVHEAEARLGPAEALLYNAVSFSAGLPSTVNPEILARDLNVNVIGALAAAQTVLPGMRERRTGTLLFTGGGWAHYPNPAFAAMGIGKGALRTLVSLLAKELDGSGVRAGSVTVMGTVERGTPFDPDRIGQAFLDLYQQPTEAFPVETFFRGA